MTKDNKHYCKDKNARAYNMLPQTLKVNNICVCYFDNKLMIEPIDKKD